MGKTVGSVLVEQFSVEFRDWTTLTPMPFRTVLKLVIGVWFPCIQGVGEIGVEVAAERDAAANIGLKVSLCV